MSAVSNPPARRAAFAAALAALAGLLAGLPGLGWGLPTEQRLRDVLPDGTRRQAILRALADPADRPADLEEADPTAACAGPIDPIAPSPEGRWLRSELVPLLLGSDDPDEMETFGSIGKIFGHTAPLDERAFLYGHVYLAVVAGAEGVALLTGGLPRIPARADLLENPGLLRRLYLSGRCVSVLAIALLAGSVAFLLRAEGEGAAAIAAGALVGLAPMAVAAAHVTKPHAFAALFGFLAAWLAWRAANRMSPSAWAIAAAALAIAASASPPYALLGIAAPLAVLAARPRVTTRVWGRCALAFVGTGIIVTLLLNPLAIARPDLLAAHAQHHLAGSGWGYGQFQEGKLAHFASRLATEDLGLGTIPLLLAGIAACVARPSPFRTYVATVTAVVFLGFGGFIGVPRIALVLAPLAALLAGVGAGWLVAGRAPGRILLALLVTALAVDVSLAVQSYRRPDPGEAAAAWIREHIAAGSCLTLRADRPLATFLPRFDLLRYRLRRIPGDAPAPAPADEGTTLVLSAVAPEHDPSAAWIEPRGPFRLLARFPGENPAGPAWLRRGPRRPRTVLILASAGPAAAAAPRGER
jgi:hypothetical protein